MCGFDKKYLCLLQYALWDKFKEIDNYKQREVENLAKFLVHLFFLEAEDVTLEFVGIILKDLRLHPYGPQKVTQVFSKRSKQPELNLVFSPKVVESLFPSSFVQKRKKKKTKT